MTTPEIIATRQSASALPEADFDSSFWSEARRLEMAYNWRGESAPSEMQTTVLAVWTEIHLCFGFECHYTELDMDDPKAEGFDARKERFALWERDVCEAFVRSPIEPDPRVYKEFEAAPNGQWCDLKVNWPGKIRDWEWQSGMSVIHETDSSSRISRIVMTLPFEAFSLRPEPGDVWHANLFRIGRLDGQRHYLALSPTLTGQPNYHVSDRFVRLVFAG
jgi:hypothetical protein